MALIPVIVTGTSSTNPNPTTLATQDPGVTDYDTPEISSTFAAQGVDIIIPRGKRRVDESLYPIPFLAKLASGSTATFRFHNWLGQEWGVSPIGNVTITESYSDFLELSAKAPIALEIVSGSIDFYVENEYAGVA